MDLILAFSLQDQVEKYGAYVGLAAFLGLAVLSLLYFAQARELKRLRDWAGRAPERAIELEARVVAQAEEALREAETAQSGTAAAAAGGNGGQVAAPAAIPMGPRPAVAAAATARAQATVEAPAVPAGTDGGGPPSEDERGEERVTPAEPEAVPAGEAPAAADDEAAAPPDEDGPSVAPSGDDGSAVEAGDDRAAVADEEPAAVADEEPAAAAGEEHVTGPTRDDQEPAPPGDEQVDEDERAAEPVEDRAAAPTGWAAAEEPDEDGEPERSGNGVPAAPATQIPRATPRPQPRPAAAAPLRASTSSRPVTIPPRPVSSRTRDGGSRAGLYTVVGILVLAAAILVPVYFMVLADDDEPAPPPNPIAEPGGSTAASAAGTSTAEARPEKVVVVLNGTPIDGLASGERDKLIEAGYSDEQGMIRIDNNQDQQCQDSVVLYGADERRQARDVSRLLDITRTEEIDEETQALADSSDQSGTLPANVVALLCADKSP